MTGIPILRPINLRRIGGSYHFKKSQLNRLDIACFPNIYSLKDSYLLPGFN